MTLAITQPQASMAGRPSLGIRHRARVALVLTRSITTDAGFGRVRTLSEIRTAMEAHFDVVEFQLSSLLEKPHLRDCMTAALAWLGSVFSGRPLPLQTVLYGASEQMHRIACGIRAGGFDAVYVDSVRCQLLLRRLRRQMPRGRVIVDFDDLMSRRMEQLAGRRMGISLGFLQSHAPKSLRWLMAGPLSAVIARYEAAALRGAELEMAFRAQGVVLVSSTERDLLRRRLTRGARQQVHALPPPAAVHHEAAAVSPPYRFIFIGSDRLAQNRLSIDCLLQLWRRLTPHAPLHIYGHQQRAMPPVEGVHWHGYVSDLADVYTGGSILLLPCLLPGGIKTKVIEAWSHGCPVLGNALAFEGLEIPGYPLSRETGEWSERVRAPEQHAVEWASAATLGHRFVRTVLSRERYAHLWRALMRPDTHVSSIASADNAVPRLVPIQGAVISDLPR